MKPAACLQVDIIGWRLRFCPTALWSLLLQVLLEAAKLGDHQPAPVFPVEGGSAAEPGLQSSVPERSYVAPAAPTDCLPDTQPRPQALEARVMPST